MLLRLLDSVQFDVVILGGIRNCSDVDLIRHTSEKLPNTPFHSPANSKGTETQTQDGELFRARACQVDLIQERKSAVKDALRISHWRDIKTQAVHDQTIRINTSGRQ
jgi:hypothetical protein